MIVKQVRCHYPTYRCSTLSHLVVAHPHAAVLGTGSDALTVVAELQQQHVVPVPRQLAHLPRLRPCRASRRRRRPSWLRRVLQRRGPVGASSSRRGARRCRPQVPVPDVRVAVVCAGRNVRPVTAERADQEARMRLPHIWCSVALRLQATVKVRDRPSLRSRPCAEPQRYHARLVPRI